MQDPESMNADPVSPIPDPDQTAATKDGEIFLFLSYLFK